MRVEKIVVYIINRKIHGCLEIPYFFLVFTMIFLTFNTRNESGIFVPPFIILYIFRAYYGHSRSRHDLGTRRTSKPTTFLCRVGFTVHKFWLLIFQKYGCMISSARQRYWRTASLYQKCIVFTVQHNSA